MSAPFHILIVEDELMISEMLKGMLIKLGYTVIGQARSFDKAVEIMEDTKKIDLALLDINLEQDKNGIDLARLINEKFKIRFAYLTSYATPEYIRQAGETGPEAYLLKPFNQDDLYATIEIIRGRTQQNHKVLVRTGSEEVPISVDDLISIKSDNIYLELQTRQKKFITRNYMDEFLQMLPANSFLRIHRSYAINISKIQSISSSTVLVDGREFPVSRRHKEELLEILRETTG